MHQSPSFDNENVIHNAHPIPDPREIYIYRQTTANTVETNNHLQYLGHFDAVSLSRTKYLNCLDKVVPLLYWYNAYHAMLNDTKAVIWPCNYQTVLFWLRLVDKIQQVGSSRSYL